MLKYSWNQWCLFSLILGGVAVGLVGCGGGEPATTTQQPAEVIENGSDPATEDPAPPKVTESTKAEVEEVPELPVITFGTGGDDAASMKSNSKSGQGVSAEATRADQIIASLKELQILLGTWRGITQKNFGDGKAVDETNWVWDFQSKPNQPALEMKSEKSPYYRKARMTYMPEDSQYQLELTDDEGEVKNCVGRFVEEIHTEPGEDDLPQKIYKLEFTEAGDGDRTRRYLFNQQNNNRYLLEVYEQRGSNDRFFRIDTVSTQREGTSMALIDEGYGERTCIISGGLGTITVSHQGETYYVCCTGCKAAFEEDPERWIARAEENSKTQ